MATPIPKNDARFTVPEIALATHGIVVQEASERGESALGVTTDSRAVFPGNVFVALRGELHDGHTFLAAAALRGASVLVVERGHAERPANVAIVEVDDTLRALGDLAHAHLSKWRASVPDGRVIAITGSAGKTTTKELTASLLAEVAPTHFTAGNLNNRIGVPAVLFALETRHRFCVLEMGMSLRGELDAITAFAPPDVSVIVNVGVAHAEGVGGREGVMHEKGAVYRALSPNGIAIVNADDDFVLRAAQRTRARRIASFGRRAFGEPGSLLAREGAPREAEHYRLVERHPEGAGSRLLVACAGRELSFFFPLPGEAAAIDLCAAIAAQEAASHTLLSAEAITRAVARVKLAGRGALRTVAGDILVLDDTYNANPASMRVALMTLGELAGNRRRVAVLGEMKELGVLAEQEHASLGDAIVDAGIALVIGCGGLVDRALDRAAERGIETVFARSTDDAAREAKLRIKPGDAVLVKGSRSVEAEKVVAMLLGDSAAG